MSRLDWLKDRQGSIGSSDSSALVGLNPWESPLSVWVSKTMPVREEDSAGEAALWGSLLEGVIIEEYGRRYGIEIERHDQETLLYHSDPRTHMHATPDGYDLSHGRELVGVKTVGFRMFDHWRDGVPLYYECQAQHEMAVLETDKYILIALFAGQRLDRFEIRRNERFIRHLERTCSEFWERHIEPMVPPEADGSDASSEALYELHPDDNGETVELGEEYQSISDELLDINEEIKQKTVRKNHLENRIKQAIGDATFGIIGDSRYSWKTQERSGKKYRVLRRGRMK